MGNHTVDCEFCGDDQRIWGDTCCRANIENDKKIKAAADAKWKEDIALLNSLGLRAHQDSPYISVTALIPVLRRLLP